MVQTPNSTSQSPTHHASPLRHAPAPSWSSLDSPPAWDQAQSTTQSDPATPDNIFFRTGGVEGGEPIMADDTLNLLLGKADYMAQSEVLSTSPIKYAAAGRHDPLGSMSMDQALNAGSPVMAYFYEQQQQQQPQVQVQPVHQHSPSPPPVSHAQVQAAAAAVHVHQPSAGMQHHQHHHHQTGARLAPLLTQQQQQQPPQRHMPVQDGGAAWNRVYSFPLGSYHHEQQQQQQQQQLGKTMQRTASTSHILSSEYGRGGGNAAYTPAAAFMHIQSRASMGMQANCSPYALPQHQHQQSTPYLTSGGLPPQSPMLKGSMISNTASHGGSVSAPYARPSGPMNPNSARGGNKNQFDFITEQQIREYANGSAGAGNGGAASEGASASQGNYPSNAEAFGLAQLLGRSPTYVESYDWTGHAALTGAPAMAGHDGAAPNAAARAQSRSSTSTPSLVEASPRFNQGLATASPASEHPYGAFPMFQEYATAAAARPNELVHTHGSPTGTSHASPSALYQPELLPKVSTSTNANNNKTTQKRYGKGTAKGARANQRSISSPIMGEASDISLFRDTPDTTCKLLDDIVPLHIRVSNLPKDKRLMFERACGDRWNQDGTSHVSPVDELRNRNVLEAMFALIGSDALANQREIPDDLVRPILERVLLPKSASKKGSRGGAEGYQCLWHGCGKGLIKRLDHAKNHVREHCGSKPHVCGSSAGSGCGQQFLRVDDLKRHQKTHCSVLRSGPGRRPRAIRGVRRGEDYEGADSDDSNSAAGGDDDEWRPSFNRIHLPQSAGGSRGTAAAAATAAESSTSSNGGNRSRGTQRRTAAATSFSVHFSSDEEDSGSEHDFGRLQTSNVRRMDSANGGRADQPFGLVDEQQQQHYHAQALRRGSTHAEERGLEDGFAE